jgi:hypothetical protein
MEARERVAAANMVVDDENGLDFVVMCGGEW